MNLAAGKTDVVERIAAIAERVAASLALEIVDVELLGSGRNRLLRISIDKPGGVSHGDCEAVSSEVGTILDVEDIVPGDHYTLEVSSPGLERKLTKPADFERFAGEKAKIVVSQPVAGQSCWIGTLKGCREGRIGLEPAAGQLIEIPFELVKKANLKFDWSREAR